ncbi:MAG TPA: 16S rRNA (guanine(966)-N(2))-methyltransferase RsmD [Marinilabiliales bacterium]|jgi:16S rRNA (guanine(966)-N(2))-methyltransferase RsmD|nr:16S rRNA (guanine(966)-N(2))-methyltransferase RsmD [Marinilabiliales bacterium]
MRIISGKYRKKNIVPPKNFRARPTTDMAKESLFNIIENEFEVESLKVLDLFGGTGSISYEFASRGCNDVTCVELNFNHYSFIKKMIGELKMDSQIQLIKANVFSYLSKCGSTFDLIFADPPYDLEGIETLPDLIFKHNLLTPEGVFILEHSKNKSFEIHTHFHLQKNYGSVNFSFFR